MGGGGFAAALHFLDIGYGPSVACTVGCIWLMYSLCMAHIWPMHDLYMAYMQPVYKFYGHSIYTLTETNGKLRFVILVLLLCNDWAY